MIRDSFADELLRLRPEGLTKTAKLLGGGAGKLYERMIVGGALAGAGGHALDSAKATMTANPYDSPQGSYAGAAKKMAFGGLLAALGLRALGKMGRRGRG